MSKGEVGLCGVCSLRVKANLVLCVQCGMWIHGRCVRVKKVTAKLWVYFACGKCHGSIGEAVEQEDKLCGGVETGMEFTYLCDRMSASGGCEAAVTARTRHVWIKFRECCELLYGRICPLRL